LPEILEVEAARALIDARALDREIQEVFAPDAWFLKRGLTPAGARAALRGQSFVAARRRGKLILVDLSSGAVLGLHLGMSGRVLVDDEAAGDPLVYASNKPDSAWHRFGVTFADGGTMFIRDPRRLGAVELDPDEDRLGPDAFDLTLAQLRRIAGRSRAPVKAVIMSTVVAPVIGAAVASARELRLARAVASGERPNFVHTHSRRPPCFRAAVPIWDDNHGDSRGKPTNPHTFLCSAHPGTTPSHAFCIVSTFVTAGAKARSASSPS